jgi:hypothetical protein
MPGRGHEAGRRRPAVVKCKRENHRLAGPWRLLASRGDYPPIPQQSPAPTHVELPDSDLPLAKHPRR